MEVGKLCWVLGFYCIKQAHAFFLFLLSLPALSCSLFSQAPAPLHLGVLDLNGFGVFGNCCDNGFLQQTKLLLNQIAWKGLVFSQFEKIEKRGEI